MPDLYSLVYVSTAARVLSMDDIGRLLDKARQRNLNEGFTGVPLYSDGNIHAMCTGGGRIGIGSTARFSSWNRYV